MTTQIEVSVVVPAYGRVESLARALESVRAQTLGEFECVVVDDASPASLAPVLDRIDDPRFRLIRRDLNGGAAAARNTGIVATSGPYIAFLDSDDEWKPQKLERQIEFIQQRRIHAAATGIGLKRYTPDGTHLWEEDRIPSPLKSVHDLVWGCSLSPGSTLMVARRVVDTVGLLDESFRRLEDWDWLIRIVARFPIEILPEVLTTVHATGRPGLSTVAAATDLILAKHGERFRALSGTAWRKVRSTAALECAASAHADGQHSSAIKHALKSLAYWPFRDRQYFANAVRHILDRKPPPARSKPAPS